LREVEWTIPPGVSAVVGPNRVGKSTLLRIPELLRVAATDSLGVAVRQVFGGVSTLRNWRLPASTPIRVGLGLAQLDWELTLDLRAGDVSDQSTESLHYAGRVLVERVAGSDMATVDGVPFKASHQSVVSALMRQHTAAPLVAQPDTLTQIGQSTGTSIFAIHALTRGAGYRAYDYEIKHLVRFGSTQSPGRALLSSGENVFPLLRNWRDSPKDEERYEFVLGTLREVFPTLGRIGFEQAGQTVTMVVNDRRWPSDKYVNIASESTGFITLLLHLCALASAERLDLLTFDEIENSLHPRAIRILVEAMRRRAASHDLRIVLATQSETVLDQFRDEPDHVFVLEPNQDRSPKLLTELFSRDYLSQFSLGDLFAHLEFGADESSQA
jgi:predicted ATPase